MDHGNADPHVPTTTEFGAASGLPAERSPTAKTRTETSSTSLAVMLRRSLDDARGNPRIRERLVQLARDSARIDGIVRTLGARHALVRDLFRLGNRSGSNA